jgi:protein-L-isoaspartate O-methyltransferase
LGIPLAFLRDRNVLEFGCNSGENALVLASMGAKLTLVEPNNQVFPRLKSLFKEFGYEKQIVSLREEGMDEFKVDQLYDVVIAECFITHLSNPEEMIAKMCDLLVLGGIGVVSIDDNYGHFLEIIRKLVFWRVCRLRGVEGTQSQSTLDIAKELFGEEFGWLSASRPFEAWYEDVLLNPFVSWPHLRTYTDVIPVLERSGCEFFSSSPKWAPVDTFSWYKNVPDIKERHNAILESWKNYFYYFLSGIAPGVGASMETASDDTVKATAEMLRLASEYIKDPENTPIEKQIYPQDMEQYFMAMEDSRLTDFSDDLKTIYQYLSIDNANELISKWHGLTYLRSLWGTTCHYMSFLKR